MVAMIGRVFHTEGTEDAEALGQVTAGAFDDFRGRQCGLRGRQVPGLAELSWP